MAKLSEGKKEEGKEVLEKGSEWKSSELAQRLYLRVRYFTMSDSRFLVSQGTAGLGQIT